MLGKKIHTKVKFFIVAAILFSVATAVSASSIQDIFTSMVKSNALPLNKQAYCIDSATNEIAGYNQTARVIPASISKLYTFDFALATLGKDFRYTTDVYLNGTTLYLNGGGDPHFVIENLRLILEEVSDDQDVVISHFVYSPNFYFNWKTTAPSITASMIASLKEDSGATINPKFTVTYAAAPYSGSGTHYQFQSAPLSILLKQINDYSTNLSADVLFQRAGGPAAFAAYMQKTYGVGSSTIQFGTGSGLSNNYTTCNLTIKVIQHLEATASSTGIGIDNIMAMPRVDPGVLQKTLMSLSTTTGIVAKSGFLDYHHNYAGIAYTTSGPIYFAVFGGYTNLKDESKTNVFVENFISKVLGTYTQVSLGYTAHNDVIGNTLVTKIGS